MNRKTITFSPVTRLSGLLSVDAVLQNRTIVDAYASSTMFRGFEWAMQNRHVTDAVYMTQRVCGICSLAHGAIASYLLDDLYDNDIAETAQLLRNVMYAADFLQNHIRHFYVFSLPDFVKMPDTPPFHGQNLHDHRFTPAQTECIHPHYYEAIKMAQKAHEILALFGGKAPHQHSFLHGGVAVAPTADKINRALALLKDIHEFVKSSMLTDTELIARTYQDYFHIGVTPQRLLSFGLFRFGRKNEQVLWGSGVVQEDGSLTRPNLGLIQEDITHAWYETEIGGDNNAILRPSPRKPGAYTWVKSVQYAGKHFQVGPLARMIINGQYHGGMSTMDRIVARSVETLRLTELMREWLLRIEPGDVPIHQNKEITKQAAVFATDAMRGTLLHRIRVENEQVAEYNIITPTVWNFSARDASGSHGPVEQAMIGTYIPEDTWIYTILGRIIRSFDPCISCATHLLDVDGAVKVSFVV